MGYGSVVLNAMARKIDELGDDVFACVLPNNGPSIRTFAKAGFKPVDSVFWLKTKPKNGSE